MSRNADELFGEIIQVFLSDQKVSQSKMFGSPGLKIKGKVFAFLMKDKLILKLPKEKVDELVAAKKGKHFGHMFAPNNWKPMKEWIEVILNDERACLKLTQEAKDFVLEIT